MFSAMTSWEFLVFFCLAVTPIFTQDCITPNGYRSECKLLDNCSPLISYMQRRPQNIMSLHEKHYINMLLCYTNDLDEQYVCCASNDRFFQLHQKTTTIRTTTTTTTPKPPTTISPTTRFTTTKRTTTSTTTTTTETTNIINFTDLDLPDPSNFECGGDVLKHRIVGGNETDLGEYPWMALLEYEEQLSRERSFACGGSLIHRRYVLTAAHCLTGAILTRKGALVNVRLGEHNTNTAPDCEITATGIDCADSAIDVGVEYTKPHPLFKITTNTMVNDIGLIRLARDVSSTAFIQPICFPPIDMISPDGMQLVVSGWGRTISGFESNVKLHVKVPIVDYSRCRIILNQIVIDDDTQICAGGEFGKDSCRGDSGGPLMRNKLGVWYIEGLVSFGASWQCGEYGKPAIYTRVNAYRGWVLDLIQFPQ